eukprot:3603358-Pyramimonas_sp.AAC.1
MAIPAMATITRVDGPAGRNSGSGKILLRPPSGPGDQISLEYYCGPQSRIGHPKNFVDSSCK